jgi:tetratricopeptide (TPR) repeat protein
MRPLLILSAVFALATSGRAADPPGRPRPVKTETPGVWAEVYTDRAAFDERLGGEVRVVDFDDVATGKTDAEPFAADRYKEKFGVVITGTDGQYAGRAFGYPADYPPKSKPNSYAPGPKPGKGKAEGFTTRVTFAAGDNRDKAGAVAGFGAVFIDADYPNLGPCALTVHGAGGRVLAAERGFSGASGSQLFRGVVTVDAGGKPVAAIRSVTLVNGNGWPASGSAEGVTLDDFAFGEPVAVAGAAVEDRGGSLKERLVRRWEYEKKGDWTQVECESWFINKRIGALGLEKAVAELNDAERAFPKEPDVLFYRGSAYLQSGERDKALAEFKALMNLQPRNEFDHTARSEMLTYLAIKMTEKKVAETDNTEAAQLLDRALVEVEAAIRLNPKYATAYGGRGVIYREQGKTDLALRDFTRAIELGPDRPWTYFTRGALYAEVKQLDRAIADLTACLELWPGHDEALRIRAIYYFDANDYRKSIADCDAYIQRFPKPKPPLEAGYVGYIHYIRGTSHGNLRDYNAALRDLTKAIELIPSYDGAHAGIYENRAQVYRKLKMPARADADLRKAAELRGPATPAPGAGNPAPRGKGKK